MSSTSKVWFCGSHHSFYDNKIRDVLHDKKEIVEATILGWHPLTSELLTKPIIGRSGILIKNNNWLLFYRAALHGLQMLEGFTSFVSFGVDVEKGMIVLPRRDWGEIWVSETKDCVLTFSHDTRKDNCPFTGIGEWLEEAWDRVNEGALTQALISWSDPKIWHTFFIRRLQGRAETFGEEVRKKRKDAEVLDARSRTIYSLLPS